MKKPCLHFLFFFFIIGNFISTEKLLAQTEAWSALGNGLNGPGVTMAFYQGDLYVAGVFSHAGTVNANNIAKWDGSTWSALGTGVNGIVYSLAVYNNELYVGGSFTYAGSH